MNKKAPWEESLKITSTLKFDWIDLMKKVDLDHEFTLRDVLRAVSKSEIPIEVLSEMLHCRYLSEYWCESKSKKFKDDGDIEYLEVYWSASRWIDADGVDDSNSWGFHGIGYVGVVADTDCNPISEEELAKLKEDGFRQAYAIEFSPMYKLANYPIRVSKKMAMEEWGTGIEHKDTSIDFNLSITLIELLYAIFWELSWSGSPKERDEKMAELDESMKEVDEAIKNGTIDEITVPMSEVRDKFADKLDKMKDAED